MANHRAIDPVTVALLNGEEATCLLSMGALRRLKTRFNVGSIKDLLNRDISEIGPPILYESLTGDQQAKWPEAEFENLVPADLNGIGKIIFTLMGVSLPDEQPGRPIQETAAPSSTGSVSGQPGPSASDDPAPNSGS